MTLHTPTRLIFQRGLRRYGMSLGTEYGVLYVWMFELRSALGGCRHRTLRIQSILFLYILLQPPECLT